MDDLAQSRNLIQGLQEHLEKWLLAEIPEVKNFGQHIYHEFEQAG